MNELTITDFYMIPNDIKLISRNELNALTTLPTSTYYIIKKIDSGRMILYTAIKHIGLPPEPIPISFNDFNNALGLANKYSYEELMKMANDTKPNNPAKIAIYLGIYKKPLPHAINSMIQQLHSVPEVNTRPSHAITKAIQEIQTNPSARRKANIKSIMAARSAKDIVQHKSSTKANNWTNSAKAAAKLAINAANRTATTRDAAKILFDKGEIDQKYMNTAIDLANTYSNEAKFATKTVANFENEAKSTAYLKLIGKKGGRNKTNRKYKKLQHRKFKTQYCKRSLRIR